MATLTITLPDRTSEWAEQRARTSGYASLGDYLRALVERERADDMEMAWPEPPELTIDDLRRIVEEARASGPGSKTVAEIFEEGNRIAKARGFFRE